MEELIKALKSVPDKYTDFVNEIASLLRYDEEYKQKVIKYIKNNPEATTSDILGYLRPYLDSIEVEDEEDEDEYEDEE